MSLWDLQMMSCISMRMDGFMLSMFFLNYALEQSKIGMLPDKLMH